MKKILFANVTDLDVKNSIVIAGAGGDPAEWVNTLEKFFKEHNLMSKDAHIVETHVLSRNGCKDIVFTFPNDTKKTSMQGIEFLISNGQFGDSTMTLKDYILAIEDLKKTNKVQID